MSQSAGKRQVLDGKPHCPDDDKKLSKLSTVWGISTLERYRFCTKCKTVFEYDGTSTYRLVRLTQ